MIAHFLAPSLLALSFLVSGTPLFGVGQGDCTGTGVDWYTGLACTGSCTSDTGARPPECKPVKEKRGAPGQPNYVEWMYCGCDGLGEPSCCHMRARRNSTFGNWAVEWFGVCTTCPLTGSCQLLNNKTTVGCQ